MLMSGWVLVLWVVPARILQAHVIVVAFVILVLKLMVQFVVVISALSLVMT